MSTLLLRFGIDPRQYTALLRLAWRHDMRQSRMGFGWQQSGRNPQLIFVITLAYYLIFGVLFASINLSAQSAFIGLSVTHAALMFLLGGIILVEYNTIIISPDDYHILGYQPVSSRTYFLAKLTNLLFYTLAFALILGGPTAFVYAFLRNGLQLLAGLTVLAGVIGAALCVSLAMVLLYGQLLRLISPARLKSILTYFQFGLSFLVYTSYLYLPKLLEGRFADMQFERENWLLLIPTSWFAGIGQLGLGPAGFDWIAALLGLASVALLFGKVFSTVSLDYAARIAAVSEEHTQSPVRAAGSARRRADIVRWFRVPENRVVARLVRAQFRHDNKFRLSVMSLVPLLIFYLYMGLREGTLRDPFITGSSGMQSFFIFFFAILMLPLLMKQNLESSNAYEASWIFYATPASQPRLVLATRNALFVLFAVPVLLFALGIFWHYFDNALHAIVHTAVISSLSFVFLQLIYLLNPKLPFSQPKTRGSQSRAMILAFFLLPALGIVLLSVIASLVYVSAVRTGILLIGLVVLAALLEMWIKQRVQHTARRLQFAG